MAAKIIIFLVFAKKYLLFFRHSCIFCIFAPKKLVYHTKNDIEMTLLERLNKTDRFAQTNGIQLTEIREGYAKAEMTVEERHLNGGNVCQGGAIFTLADLAIAAVMNSHGLLTLGIENQVTYVSSALLGDHLIAEAVETVNHKKIPFAQVTIKKATGETVASCTALAYRKQAPMEYDALM